jgi:hypothetical protein
MDRPEYEIDVVKTFLNFITPEHYKAFNKIIEYLNYRVKQVYKFEKKIEDLENEKLELWNIMCNHCTYRKLEEPKIITSEFFNYISTCSHPQRTGEITITENCPFYK